MVCQGIENTLQPHQLEVYWQRAELDVFIGHPPNFLLKNLQKQSGIECLGRGRNTQWSKKGN